MKLNIDETNDHLGDIVDDVWREFPCPNDEISDEDWNRMVDPTGKLFELACVLSTIRCRGQYDTDQDDVIADCLRAWLTVRVSEVAPNGILLRK
jgi:hypothetical protein